MNDTVSTHNGAAGAAGPAAPDSEHMGALLSAAGVPEEIARSAIEWSPDRWTGEHARRDDADRRETEAELRRVLGSDYEASVTRLRKYMRHNLPTRASQKLLDARDADGRALFNRPDVLLKFHSLAQRAASMPPSRGDIDADISAIESLIGTDEDTYRADPGLRLRLQDLLSQRAARRA